jgi:hypothetical protein
VYFERFNFVLITISLLEVYSFAKRYVFRGQGHKAEIPHTLKLHFMRMQGNDVDTLAELVAHVQRRAAAIAEQSGL